MTPEDIADDLRITFRSSISSSGWTPGIVEVEWDSPTGPLTVRSIASWREGSEDELEASREFRLEHAERVLVSYRDKMSRELEEWVRL